MLTEKQIDKLEIKALALRKIADEFLDEVRAFRASAPRQGLKKQRELDRCAAIRARVLSKNGRKLPPNNISVG